MSQWSKVMKLRWGSHQMNEVGKNLCSSRRNPCKKHSISISNRSCLIHWPTGLLEGCQFVKAASAQQHLLMMQHPSVSQPPLHRMWSGRCLLHDMKHVERREQGECLGYRTQSQWDGKTKSQLVLSVISLPQWRLSTPDLDHTLCVPFRILPGLLFYLRTEEDNVSSLLVCLCRSWLQMCLCRGSLDLRRAVVGVLVRTALEVASSWTLKAVASPHQVFKSPLYISLSGMTWTQCLIQVCGQCCPTLTCHISSVEPAYAGPKGNS